MLNLYKEKLVISLMRREKRSFRQKAIIIEPYVPLNSADSGCHVLRQMVSLEVTSCSSSMDENELNRHPIATSLLQDTCQILEGLTLFAMYNVRSPLASGKRS